MSSAKGQLRTIEPIEDDEESSRGPRPEVLKCSYRPPDANFFCWKYGVWYNVMDCCYRHFRKTFSGCADCGQGRNNLKVNQERFLAGGHPGERRRFDR